MAYFDLRLVAPTDLWTRAALIHEDAQEWLEHFENETRDGKLEEQGFQGYMSLAEANFQRLDEFAREARLDLASESRTERLRRQLRWKTRHLRAVLATRWRAIRGSSRSTR